MLNNFLHVKKFLKIIPLVLILGAGSYFFLNRDKDSEAEVREDMEHEGLEDDNPQGFNTYHRQITVPFGAEESGYPAGYRITEFEKAVKRRSLLKSASEKLPWVSRGPYNVAGRVRGLIVDPDDTSHNTWFVGSASGGIWKTTDKGLSFRCLTDTLPNLSVSWLTMAPSNHSVIYACTGEGFGGSGMVSGDGILKSTDKGDLWNFLANTRDNEDFRYVNRLVVDPADENIVVAVTNTGIFKTTDGGATWQAKYKAPNPVQDIVADPADFNVLYASVNSLGVVKSTDAGNTWKVSSSGMGSCRRIELAVSPVNHLKVFALVESGTASTYMYYSDNQGQSWRRFKAVNNTDPVDFLGDQGWYCNTITCHPYDENTVFVGGVYLGRYTLYDQVQESLPMVVRVDTTHTGSFLSFVNFGGTWLSGGMETGDKNGGTNLDSTDWTSVQIRFGKGLTQKAYRFTVPPTSGSNHDGGAKVDNSDYQYQDYVDVPFQVWDVKNNRQLMVSFRDQERDGTFNLIERTPDNNASGREYIFVSAVPYSETPDTSIAKTAGHTYKQLYFFWPTLAPFGVWNPASLPEADLTVEYGSIKLQMGQSVVLSDPYGTWNSINANLHPDHHHLIVIPTDTAGDRFSMLEANDGGLGYSGDEGNTWKQISKGMITTQFYGVAKKFNAHEYIGGMQDNGTWQSPSGVQVSDSTYYLSRIGGDGFDVVWNQANPDILLGSVYNNRF